MVKKAFSYIIYIVLIFLSVFLKGQNNRNDKEACLFTEYFGIKKYSYPSTIDFNARNKDYLGINSKDLDSKGYSEIVINNEYIDYQINQNYKFIKIRQDDLPDLDHVKTEIKQNKKLPYFEDVLDLNKVLYQDDKNAIANIINWKKDLAADIVILFDYEKDDQLIKTAIKNITSIDDQPKYFNWSILFYNDKSKDQTIRKQLLLKIFNNNANLISDLVSFIANNKTPFNQTKTDEALVYLLNLQLKKNESKDWQQNEGFGMLSYCYDKDRDLMKRLKSTNFYNDSLIKNATEAYNTFNQQETAELYTIQDPDGYTNLRKDKNTASEVLQKIKSGEKVNVLDQNGDWWLVETKEGKQGYVHKSRIR